MKTNRIEIPEQYVNIAPYVKKTLGELPDPPVDPTTQKPVGPEALAPLFPRELIAQEMSMEKRITIPDEVRELYRMYRPTPLIRAKRLENALRTPAHIYFKYEGVSPVGSHKLNTALAQAYYNKKEGIRELTTETGAGQWGTALALACNMFGLSCRVFMVKHSYETKPYRRTIMKLYGAHIAASPSSETQAGKQFQRDFPDTTGSLGMAISEAIELAAKREDTHYALGSVLNHVLMHQTIIGTEAKEQMFQFEEYPDIVIGCCGGGSNFAGISYPFLIDRFEGRKNIRFIAVEPKACPSLTEGEYRYDHGDSAGLTPMFKMYTVGKDYVPAPIHAGGLRYHGDAPMVSFLYNKKQIEAAAYEQDEVFAAARLFASTEGYVPAPESAHAIVQVIKEAKKAKIEGKKKVILFNLSGHGLLDLGAYEEVGKGRKEHI